MTLDNLITFLQSRIRLSKTQELIIRGCWEKKTYIEISQSYNRARGGIKTQAWSLWKSLSDEFGEKVTKVNFRQVLLQHFVSSPQKKSLKKVDYFPKV